ncbi:hypothetical protein SprV_0100257100 [Sparganum proliferum]
MSCDSPSEGKVIDAIRKLRNNKAPGEDGIPAEINKSCVDIGALAPRDGERLTEMHGFSKRSLSALSTPSSPSAIPLSHLEIGLAMRTDDIAALQKQTASPLSQSPPKPFTLHVQCEQPDCSSTAVTCWYHATFGVKTRRCIYPCSFTSKQSKRVKRVSPKVSAANLPDNSNPSRTFYFHETLSGRRFLVGTGAQLSVVPPTTADRRCPNPGLLLQAVNTVLITTISTCSLSLDIGFRRISSGSSSLLTPLGPFSVQISSPLSIFFSTAVSPVYTTRPPTSLPGVSLLLTLTVNPPSWTLNPRIHFKNSSPNIPGLTLSNFSAAIPPHDVIHRIRTTSPPVLSRPRRLTPARLSAAKANLAHMLWALNNVTVLDRYPVPHLQNFVGAQFGKSVLSKIALVWTFHQIPITPEAVSKTAVTTPIGLLEPLRMSFRPRNASQTFQSLRQVSVVLNPFKCVFGVPPPLEFLGYPADSNSIHLLPSKVAAIRGFPSHSSKRQLNDFWAWRISRTVSSRTVKTPSCRSRASSRAPKHLLEGKNLTVFMDHEPLPFALKTNSDKLNPREIRQLDYISQFISDIRRTDGLRCTRIRTIANPPEANRMVDRFHRQLKVSLRTADYPEDWTNHLPLILLGIHSSFKSDPGFSAAELAFGTTVRLPGEMVLSTPRKELPTPSVSHILFSEGIVRRELEALNESKSPGPDEIPPKLLKELASELSVPLSMLFQTSFDTGTLPIDWKLALITPLYKGGSRASTTNYRPISLTCILCKVMERIMKNELIDFLEVHGLLSNCQHGFRKGRSCTTNLLRSLQSWTRALDDRHEVHIAFIDFQKAFDTVPHQRLLRKLKKIGIGGNFLKWIENFLLGRHQVVCIGQGKSDPAMVGSGVPQGSVLGPILFLIYVDDAARALDCEVAMFADDMKIWSVIRGPADEDILQVNLNRLEEWSSRWLLRFNVGKCSILRLGNTTRSAITRDYSLGGAALQEVEAQKDLVFRLISFLKILRRLVYCRYLDLSFSQRWIRSWNGQFHNVPIQSSNLTQPGSTPSYSLGGPLFNSLNDLISYYKDNQLPIDLKSGAILFTPVFSQTKPTSVERSSDGVIPVVSKTRDLRSSDSDLSINRCPSGSTYNVHCNKGLCRRPATRAFNEARNFSGLRKGEFFAPRISDGEGKSSNTEPDVVLPTGSASQNGALKKQEVDKPKLDRKQIRYLVMNEQPSKSNFNNSISDLFSKISDSPPSPSQLRHSDLHNPAYGDLPSDTGSLPNSYFQCVQTHKSRVNSASLQNLPILTDVYADPSLFTFSNISKTYATVPFETSPKPSQSPSSGAHARNSSKPPLPLTSSRPQSAVSLQLDVLCQGFINYDLTRAERLSTIFESQYEDNFKPLDRTLWQSIGTFLLSDVQPSNLAKALSLECVHLLMLRWANSPSTSASSGPSDGFSLILWPAANGYREDLLNRDRFLSLFVVASVVLQPQLERRAQILLLWLRTINCLLSEYKDNLSSTGLLNGIFSVQVCSLTQTWRSLLSMAKTEITQESLSDLRSQMVSVERCPLSTRAVETYASCFSTTDVCIPNVVPLVSLLCRAARSRFGSTDRQRSLSGSLSSLFEGSTGRSQEQQSAQGLTPVPSPGLIAYLDTARRVFRTVNTRRSSISSSCPSSTTQQTSLWIEKLEKSQSEAPPSKLRKLVTSESFLLSLIGPVVVDKESQIDLFHTKLNHALTCLAERLEG